MALSNSMPQSPGPISFATLDLPEPVLVSSWKGVLQPLTDGETKTQRREETY